jgi:hypothetical protein
MDGFFKSLISTPDAVFAISEEICNVIQSYSWKFVESISLDLVCILRAMKIKTM